MLSKGINGNSTVADIGSGTGILSKALIEFCEKLFAVEPNKEMREYADKTLGSYDNFISVAASAEETSLKDNSVDFITVAQAFHWFDRQKTMMEFKRILKPAGRLFLIWNQRLNNTEFLKAYESFLRDNANDYKNVNHRNISEKELEALFLRNYEKREFENHQDFDMAGFIGRVLSSSYTPEKGDPKHESFKEALEHLFEKYSVNAKVRFEYRTEIYSGEF